MKWIRYEDNLTSLGNVKSISIVDNSVIVYIVGDENVNVDLKSRTMAKYTFEAMVSFLNNDKSVFDLDEYVNA